MKNQTDPEKGLKKTLKKSMSLEKPSMRAEKQSLKAAKKGDTAKAMFKSKVADIKYTKAMREIPAKEARTAIKTERKAYKATKKGM
jgi:hypothetical protein